MVIFSTFVILLLTLHVLLFIQIIYTLDIIMLNWPVSFIIILYIQRHKFSSKAFMPVWLKKKTLKFKVLNLPQWQSWKQFQMSLVHFHQQHNFQTVRDCNTFDFTTPFYWCPLNTLYTGVYIIGSCQYWVFFYNFFFFILFI